VHFWSLDQAQDQVYYSNTKAMFSKGRKISRSNPDGRPKEYGLITFIPPSLTDSDEYWDHPYPTTNHFPSHDEKQIVADGPHISEHTMDGEHMGCPPIDCSAACDIEF
jgi:hypothetical protein